MNGRRILKRFFMLLTLASIAGPFSGDAYCRERCYSANLNDNGSFNMDYLGYRLICKDILSVTDKAGSCRYLIPEEERPAFATLLHPTFSGIQRKNHLEISRTEGEQETLVCFGKKTGVITFSKKYLLYAERIKVEVNYELSEEGMFLEYFLLLPPQVFDGCEYTVQTAGGKEIMGTTGEQEGCENIKKAVFSSRAGEVSFVAGSPCVFRRMFRADGTGAEYYILCRGAGLKGSIIIEIILKNCMQ